MIFLIPMPSPFYGMLVLWWFLLKAVFFFLSFLQFLLFLLLLSTWHQSVIQVDYDPLLALRSVFQTTITNIAIEMSDTKSATRITVDPFNFHHGDSPGTVLVSQIRTWEKCSTWSRSMTIALNTKNKFEFLDGSIKRPDKNDGA